MQYRSVSVEMTSRFYASLKNEILSAIKRIETAAETPTSEGTILCLPKNLETKQQLFLPRRL
jgi:hypothetical protein